MFKILTSQRFYFKNKQTNKRRKKTYFFLFDPHLGDACTSKEDSLSLSLIYLYSWRGKESRVRGVLLCLLSVARKTFANWKLRNHKSDVNETCMFLFRYRRDFFFFFLKFFTASEKPLHRPDFLYNLLKQSFFIGLLHLKTSWNLI